MEVIINPHDKKEKVKDYGTLEATKSLIDVDDPVYYLVKHEDIFSDMHTEIVIAIFIDEKTIDEICEDLGIDCFKLFELCHEINTGYLERGLQLSLPLTG